MQNGCDLSPCKYNFKYFTPGFAGVKMLLQLTLGLQCHKKGLKNKYVRVHASAHKQ